MTNELIPTGVVLTEADAAADLAGLPRPDNQDRRSWAGSDTSDTSIEQEIQAKGLTAPRITPDDIDANIVGEHYHSPSDYTIGCGFNIGRFDSEKIKRHTICILTLRNGFTVVGVNEGPVSQENFDAEIGRKIARANAVQKIWPLLGFALKEKLHAEGK